MRSPIALSLVLLSSLTLLPAVQADDLSILETPQDLESVVCPTSQTTFTALTEMVLEGRNELLSLDERLELNDAFQKIYNALSQQNCDSYFRRIANLTFVNMTNTLGDSTTLGTAEGRDGSTRWLQANSPTPSPTIDFNTTSVPGVDITYEVTGTCRECPLTRAGAFELYDQAARRALQEQTGIRLRQVRVLQTSTVPLSVDLNDCQCVVGTTPTQPQPPGVQECVDEMNLKVDNLRTNKGLFQELKMAKLLQLDEGLDELDHDNNDNKPSSGGGGGDGSAASSSGGCRQQYSSLKTVSLGLLLGAAVATFFY